LHHSLSLQSHNHIPHTLSQTTLTMPTWNGLPVFEYLYIGTTFESSRRWTTMQNLG